MANAGELSGNILSDEHSKSMQGVTVTLKSVSDSASVLTMLSDAEGSFHFSGLAMGWYRLSLSFSGHATKSIDSIHLRGDRPHAILADLGMSISVSLLETIVIHAEKPLLENKDGNIIFNATESPLSAGSSAAELLKNIPLVNQDPDGQVTIRGREPRILVDDKPVQLNAQQMQDFLESMPGSMIDRIEVMTNPPAQYANEPGGVINIVTRKGKAGWSGRINVSAGTRGESNVNGSMNMRKKGLSLQVSAGTGQNRFEGDGNTIRENRYADSSNKLITRNHFVNRSLRPNLRVNLDYDINPRNIIGATLMFNSHDYRNRSGIDYANENRYGMVYRRSDRGIMSDGENLNPSANLSYTRKGKTRGEQLRVIGSFSLSNTDAVKDFRQVFYDGDYIPTGKDTAQEQYDLTKNKSMQFRVSYDKPVKPEMTIISAAFAYNRNDSYVDMDSYDKELDGSDLTFMPLLSNEFRFLQQILTYTLSGKQKLGDRFWFTSGITLEGTDIYFDLVRDKQEVSNSYSNWLPFANINKNWKGNTTLNLSYRSTIRRPGIRELNPAIDFSDPYNVRFGNPDLLPSPAHAFDIVYGKNLSKWQMNAGLGYNKVDDIFATVRTLREDGKTQITWENISGRQEFEANAWVNLPITKSLRMNANASYTFNKYSDFDIEVKRYRNGSSANAKVNVTYAPSPVWNLTGNLSFNRFANPQGSVRSNVNMVFGGQYKFFKRRLSFAVQAVDPFVQQKYRTVTEGLNFTTESQSLTQTRNFRFTLSYNLANVKPASKNQKNQKAKPITPKKDVMQKGKGQAPGQGKSPAAPTG